MGFLYQILSQVSTLPLETIQHELTFFHYLCLLNQLSTKVFKANVRPLYHYSLYNQHSIAFVDFLKFEPSISNSFFQICIKLSFPHMIQVFIIIPKPSCHLTDSYQQPSAYTQHHWHLTSYSMAFHIPFHVIRNLSQK